MYRCLIQIIVISKDIIPQLNLLSDEACCQGKSAFDQPRYPHTAVSGAGTGIWHRCYVSAKFGLGKNFPRKPNTWVKCDQKPDNQ